MILDTIVKDKLIRLEEQKQQINETEMKRIGLECQRESIPFYDALSKPGLSIIGEFKKASPSMGVIDYKLDLEERIDQYNVSVDAISCLTEEGHFHGSTAYFEEIRKISSLPMIRKDFIVDPYQVYEAKVIGADAILLIAAILKDADMKRLYELSYSLGMDVLVEVHDEKELERALKLDARIIGVNNRNLKDFSISLNVTKRLADMIPEGTVFVSESGVTKDQDIAFLKICGVDALLIGRAFMESGQPEALAKHWKNMF